MIPFSIHYHGSRPHCDLTEANRHKLRPRPEREHEQDGPVKILVRDGKPLEVPEVIELRESA